MINSGLVEAERIRDIRIERSFLVMIFAMPQIVYHKDTQNGEKTSLHCGRKAIVRIYIGGGNMPLAALE